MNGKPVSIYLPKEILQLLDSEKRKLRTKSRSHTITVILEKYFAGELVEA